MATKTNTRAEPALQFVSLRREPQPDDPGQCRAVMRLLDRIGDKWTVMAVGVLSRGPQRFNAIQREIQGLSHRMLTITLRGLERDGLVNRTAFATIPPKVEYELTELGWSLLEPLQTMAAWAFRNQPVVESAQAAFDAARDEG